MAKLYSGSLFHDQKMAKNYAIGGRCKLFWALYVQLCTSAELWKSICTLEERTMTVHNSHEQESMLLWKAGEEERAI